MRWHIAILAGLLPAGCPATAQTLDTAGATSCEVRGDAIDTDPRGTNVRAAPRADAPIIGHLAPPTKIDPNTDSGVEFDIVGSKDGWLLIRNGSDGVTFDAAHKADGRGWVSAKLVGTQLRLPAFRSAPRRDAPEIAHFMGDTWAPTAPSSRRSMAARPNTSMSPRGRRTARPSAAGPICLVRSSSRPATAA